jgi:aspartate carbamoyltransferase catalytic subunit
LRHSSSGAPHLLSDKISASIINAGDGANEHPSQALLDMFTIKEKMGKIEGLKVVIIGDITHSRVARSNIIGLKKMGAEVTISGPPTMIPHNVDALGVKVINNPSEAIVDKDVIMVLRIQLERQSKTLFPSLREYSNFFGIDEITLQKAKKEAIIMHPGPVNRGVELSSQVVDGSSSLILNQVSNGVAIRMALLYLLIGGTRSEDIAN